MQQTANVLRKFQPYDPKISLLCKRMPCLPYRVQLRLKPFLLQHRYYFFRRIIVKPASRAVAKYKRGKDANRDQKPYFEKRYGSCRRFFIVFLWLYLMKRSSDFFHVLLPGLRIIISTHLTLSKSVFSNVDILYADRRRLFHFFVPTVLCQCVTIPICYNTDVLQLSESRRTFIFATIRL